MVKGPFRKSTEGADNGIKALETVARTLNGQGITIQCLIVFGPLLSKHNSYVIGCKLHTTYEEATAGIMVRLHRVFNGIPVVVVPSTEDITNLYPIPIPAPRQPSPEQKVVQISNPGTVILSRPDTEIKLTFINSNLYNFMDNHRGGSRSNTSTSIE